MRRLLILFLLLPGHLYAQAWSGIIAPSRAADWSSVGATIPNRTVICANVTPADTSTTINSKALGCPDNQVLQFAAGNYTLANGFRITHPLTVRGQGPLNTIVNFGGGDGCNGISGDVCMTPTANQFFIGSTQVQPGGSNACTWTAGFAQGATSLTLINCGSAGLSNGQVIILDQLNDAGPVGGSGDPNGVLICDTFPGCRIQSGGNADGRPGATPDRSQSQLVTVTAGCPCTGAGPFTVTITPAVKSNNWRIGQTPGIWWTNRVANVGLEAMTINHGSSSASAGIVPYDCDNCWVANVRSETANRAHVRVYQSSHVTVHNSYFYNTQSHASQSYGIEPFLSSDNLVENNIFQLISSPVLFGNGQGWVIGYNFSINDQYDPSINWQQNNFSSHNAGAGFNLWEGNEMDGSIYCDTTWGTSNLITEFRNWSKGRGFNNTTQTTLNDFAVALQSGCRGFNVIGNVLGTAGYHNQYQDNPGTTTNCDKGIYNLGFAGTECGNSSSMPNDNLVASTLMRWGNYDVVNAAVRWDSVESSPPAVPFIGAQSTPASHTLPASFYLPSKPLWWGSNPYPSIGPDVTGGTGPGGFAYVIPAHTCYTSIGGSATGTGTVLAFDANVCYPSSPPPPPPTNVNGQIGAFAVGP